MIAWLAMMVATVASPTRGTCSFAGHSVKNGFDPAAASPGHQPSLLEPERPELPKLEGVVQLKGLQGTRGHQLPVGDQTPLALLMPDEVTQTPPLPVLSGMRAFDRGLLPHIGRSSAEEGDAYSPLYPATSAMELVLQPPPLPEIEVR